MKNQYLFFSEQSFSDLDLGAFSKTDTLIPETKIHVYSFECIKTKEYADDMARATKLDELTKRLTETYPEQFQIIDSGSSQFFCKQIYPHVVSFETGLRYALYLAGALYKSNSENNTVNKGDFLYEIDGRKLPIEELDFGRIYQCIFTDGNMCDNIKRMSNRRMTKAEWQQSINAIEEKTVWGQMTGGNYGFIAENFKKITGYRNHVMHNHLISFNQYEEAMDVLKKANKELDKVVKNVLLANNNEYLKDFNILSVLGALLDPIGTITKQITGKTPLEMFGQFMMDHILAEGPEQLRISDATNQE